MKIVVNTDNYEILNSIIREAKKYNIEIIIAKLEKKLFELIEDNHIAYVIGNNKLYSQKAVDFIKDNNQYTPVIIMQFSPKEIMSSDVVIPFSSNLNTDIYANSILYNINSYIKNFETLHRLTSKILDTIKCGECVFDPRRRLLFYKGEQKHKLSPKQGKIFEILATNFGQVVDRDIILERGWGDINYFKGRSMDVFVTNLRKILKNYKINLEITTITNVGLMLDFKKEKK